MSINQMSKVWDHPAVQDRTTLLVMLALADFANDEGWCWPSVATIAKRARTSDRQVRRILEKLNGLVLPNGSRLIEIEENRGRKGKGEYHTNRYKLNLTQCPISFGLIPVIGDSENLTSEPVNLTNSTVKPDTMMSYEPSGTITKKQPSKEPTREFNSTECGKFLALRLNLNGCDLMELCKQAIETAMRELHLTAEQAFESISAKWDEYEHSQVEYKVGKIKYLKQSEFLNGAQNTAPMKWRVKE